jgi:hypothetical protein
MGPFGQAKLIALILLFPLLAEGAVTVIDRGISSNATNQASTAMSPSGTIAAGSTGILMITADPAAGNAINLPTSITDSKSNVWKLWLWNISNNIANAGVEIAMYVCVPLTTSLLNTDNVTVTYTGVNVTAKCWAFYEITPATSGNIILPMVRPSTSSIANTTSPTLVVDQNIVVGNATVAFVGSESADNWTADTDALNGSWSTPQRVAQGTGATGMTLLTEYKVQTTANSPQTFNPTQTPTSTCGLGVASFAEVDPKVKLAYSRTSSATTTVVYPSRTIAAGSFAVCVVALDNAGALGAVTASDPGPITDSAGNVWTRQLTGLFDNGAANAGSELAVYTSQLTANMTPPYWIIQTPSGGTSLTFTWDAGVLPPAKGVAVYEFVPDSGFNWQYSAGATAAGSATTAPTVTSSSLASGAVIVGVLASEGIETITNDSDASNGSWTTGVTTSVGAGTASGMSLCSQYKITTGAGTQTFNPTVSATNDTIIGWVSLVQVAAASTSATSGFFQWF